MHNGRMGRKVDQLTVERAQELFRKGFRPGVVAARLGISESMARNIHREMPKQVQQPSECSEPASGQ
jgi:hypothetical protein